MQSMTGGLIPKPLFGGQSVKSGSGQTLLAVMDVFWADFYGQSTGPLVHMWTIATHKEIFLVGDGKNRV
jgi:hypothetical protein